MGRFIDADEVNEAIYKSFEDIQFYDGTGYNIYSDSKEIIDKIPTVEAIQKDQYEARLKADMVAMLTDIQLEIEEKRNGTHAGNNEMLIGVLLGIDDCSELIQQKINELKENKDGSNNN